MRKLIMKDLVSVAQIMTKANLKAKVNDILKFLEIKDNEKNNKDSKSNNEKNKNNNTYNTTVMGVNCIIAVIEILGDSGVEQNIYDLLTDIFGEDAQNMELDKLIKNLGIIFKENDMSSFFKLAGQLM